LVSSGASIIFRQDGDTLNEPLKRARALRLPRRHFPARRARPTAKEVVGQRELSATGWLVEHHGNRRGLTARASFVKNRTLLLPILSLSKSSCWILTLGPVGGADTMLTLSMNRYSCKYFHHERLIGPIRRMAIFAG
jgi:hypothetical protein